jgi:hypothetical protein
LIFVGRYWSVDRISFSFFNANRCNPVVLTLLIDHHSLLAFRVVAVESVIPDGLFDKHRTVVGISGMIERLLRVGS